MSVFKDQKQFMDICGQKPSLDNVKLYMDLITEEFNETIEAFRVYRHNPGNPHIAAELVDGAIDLIYVAAGMIHSAGFDPQPFWNEVQRSNLSKFTQLPDGTYSVKRREDGKILKPASYTPPNLVDIVREQRGD